MRNMIKKNRFLSLFFPLINTKTNEREQYDKVIEEYNEFRKELFSEAPPEITLSELFDLNQAYFHYLCAKVRPFCIDEYEAVEKVIAIIEQANQDHRKKIERYRAERGWE